MWCFNGMNETRKKCHLNLNTWIKVDCFNGSLHFHIVNAVAAAVVVVLVVVIIVVVVVVVAFAKVKFMTFSLVKSLNYSNIICPKQFWCYFS